MSDNDSRAPSAAPAADAGGHKRAGQFRREKRDVHGWVVLDKPIGMTSTQDRKSTRLNSSH